ncbi:hypothetical protein ElyMa_003876100 [Elysia marginata]|uniref:Uncharacterized protein n=1 Tax=Elysia marginata TaxID=1093978 RepID=A0AAV4FLX9_9GAST|nr:hypothetical protein ElyMa_003876100 [Elysia marginata]
MFTGIIFLEVATSGNASRSCRASASQVRRATKCRGLRQAFLWRAPPLPFRESQKISSPHLAPIATATPSPLHAFLRIQLYTLH